jgi:hypothetical protein
MRGLLSSRRVKALIAALLAGTLLGCGVLDSIGDPNGLAIKKFALSPKETTPGVASALSWEVEGAESIQIDNGIGVVKAKGSIEVKADRTTTYGITARTGTSTATASVQLLIGPAASVSPSPSATPTPSPTPTPAPTPTPTATPTPRPSPSGSSACGPSVESVQGCAVTIQRLQTLPSNECVEITRIALSQGCPMAMGASRAVSFEVMAETQLRDLRWRKLASGRDSLDPPDGHVIRHGATTAIATQTVQEGALTIEVISEGTPILSFRLKNN